MDLNQALALLRRNTKSAGGQAAWARAHGVSAAYVTEVLSLRSEPGKKILDALGLEKAPAEYRRKKL